MKPIVCLSAVLILFLAECANPQVKPPNAGESGSAVAIQPMTTGRASHSATLLPDGKVLISGGFNGNDNLSSAELFDPDSRTFMLAGTMITPRASHSATMLPNGKVLIAGGLNGGWLSSAELYDPATGKFSPTGPMTGSRSDHVAVLLDNGKVLLAGGVGAGYTFLAEAELYDPSTGVFMATGSMTVPREGHAAALLGNGKVLITGGHKDRHAAITIFSSAELYDPGTGTFRVTGTMTVRRHKHDATLLPGGAVLISGGADERDDQGAYTSAELYDPDKGTFTEAGNMNVARYKHEGTSLLLNTGAVLLIGGASLTEIYDPVTTTFSRAKNSTNATRLFAAATVLGDGHVLFTGGYGPNVAASAQAWVFQP